MMVEGGFQQLLALKGQININIHLHYYFYNQVISLKIGVVMLASIATS